MELILSEDSKKELFLRIGRKVFAGQGQVLHQATLSVNAVVINTRSEISFIK